MIPPIVVLILSWGLSSIIGELGFVNFVTGIVASRIPVFLIPAVIYLIGCFASYFMGSAWGTWALIMPMAVPLAVSTHLNLPTCDRHGISRGSTWRQRFTSWRNCHFICNGIRCSCDRTCKVGTPILPNRD